MYIEKVELENFRGFAGTHEIVLHPELTVFAGVNGSGKSAVLDAIGSLMCCVAAWMEYPSVSWVTGSDDNVHTGTTGGCISVRLASDEESGTIGRRFFTGQRTDSIKVPGTAKFLNKFVSAGNGIRLPFWGQVPAGSGQQRMDGCPDTPGAGRFRTYRGAVGTESVPFSDLEDWFEYEENLENQLKIRGRDFNIQISSLKFVRLATARALSALHGCTLGKPGVLREHGTDPLEPAKGRLYIIKGELQLYASQLSEGERRILLVIMDVARRMVILNPQAEDPTMVPGILAVDEVELHLHPQWQRTVVACLRAAFPKLQLLLSTHSPIVLSSVPNECVVMMGPNGVIGGKSQTYGRDPNSILEVEMGTPLHPDEVEKKLKELNVALDTNLRKAKKMVKDLELSWGQDHPELVRARAYLGLMGG